MKAKRRSAGAEGHYLKWMLALLFIAILLALLVPGVNAEWYRREVTINNSGSSALTDYQVLVTLSGSGNYTEMNSDGSDIRFTDSGNNTKYDYWIEDWNDGGTSKIWVEVPSVPIWNSTMYLWSNSPGASSESNGDATFQFFDDFDNLGSWSTSLASVSNGILTLEPNGINAAYVARLSPTGYNLAIRTKQLWDMVDIPTWNEQGTGWASVGAGSDYMWNDIKNCVAVIQYVEEDLEDWETRNVLRTKKDPHAAHTSVTEFSGSWHTFEVRRLSNKAEFSFEDHTPVTSSSRIPTGSYNQHIWYQRDGSDTLQADWFAIRKYSGSDPTTSVGDPKSAGGGAPVPELPTVILFSVGLIVLAGYVLLRRREKKKGK